MMQFDKLSSLLKQPYFTSRDARAVDVHPASLAYYLKIGRLKRLRRGIYQSNSPSPMNSLQWGDLLQVIYSIPESVICLTSALAIYGYTEEIARQHWIAIRHSTRAKPSKLIKIVRMRNMTLGKTEILLDGATVPIFDRERTIVDAFRQLSRETAIKALKTALTKKGAERLDVVKLQTYAKTLRVPIEPYLLALAI